ncbi:MAG: sulfurtransferase TusA family protein [Gemmobacter sp.]
MTGSVTWDAEIDASGLLCPLPVLRARKRLRAMAGGQVLRLVATDPAAVIDVPHFCAEAGHDLIATGAEGAAQVYLIRRGGA